MQVFDKDHLNGAVKFKVNGLSEESFKAGIPAYTVRFGTKRTAALQRSLARCCPAAQQIMSTPLCTVGPEKEGLSTPRQLRLKVMLVWASLSEKRLAAAVVQFLEQGVHQRHGALQRMTTLRDGVARTADLQLQAMARRRARAYRRCKKCRCLSRLDCALVGARDTAVAK